MKNAERLVEGTFLALNGDSFFEIDLDYLIGFHSEGRLDRDGGFLLGTIAVSRVPDARNYGVVTIDQVTNRIISFSEKGGSETSTSGGVGLINAGIYVLEPDIFRLIPSAKKVSMEREVFPFLINAEFYLLGCSQDGFFVDIGTPEGYRKYQNHLEEEINDRTE